MKLLEYQAIETVIVILLYIVVRFSLRWFVRKRQRSMGYAPDRVILIRRILAVLSFIIFAIILSSIWGIEQSDIILFITSILTVIGIAFFAQWSILSNITSGLVLFFSNDIRSGEHVTIMEKDMEISGVVLEIGIMFTRIKTDDKGLVSIPNSIIMQKMISVDRNEGTDS